MRVAAFVTIAHQSSLLQDSKMLRNGRLRDSCLSGQGGDRQVPVAAQPFKNGTPRWVGERSEKDIVGVRHM
jgi:hypothetical protein